MSLPRRNRAMRAFACLLLLCAPAAAQDVYVGKKQIEPAHVVQRKEKLYVHIDDLRKEADIAARPIAGREELAVWRGGRGGPVKIEQGKGAVREPDGLYLGMEVLEDLLGMKVDYKGATIVIHNDKVPSEPQRLGIGPGHAIPDLALPPLDGGKATPLSKLESPVLIYFWASWEEGRGDLEKWDAFARENRKEVSVVCVAVDMLTDRVRKFVPKKMKTPVLHDPGGRTAALLGLERLPHWILVDEVGLIRGSGRTIADVESIRPLLAEERYPKKKWLGAAFVPEPRKRKDWQDAVRDDGDDAYLRLGLASCYIAEGLEAAAGPHVEKAMKDKRARPYAILFQAVVMLAEGKKDEAVAYMREVRWKHRDCQLIRKQIWALRFPEEFYNDNDEINFVWQKEKERLERLGQDD